MILENKLKLRVMKGGDNHRQKKLNLGYRQWAKD